MRSGKVLNLARGQHSKESVARAEAGKVSRSRDVEGLVGQVRA